MTTERKVLICLCLLLLVLSVIAGRAIWVQHDEIIKADSEVKVREAQIETLQVAIRSREAADEAQQNRAKQDQAAVKTAADAVRVITKLVTVPGAPVDVPQTITLQRADLSGDVAAKLPDSPDYVIQTSMAAQQVAKDLLQCRADQRSLESCKADKADLQAMYDLQGKNAQTWKNAAKGGSVAKRVWDVAKCAAFAGGGAWTAHRIGRDAQAAAVGAAAGAVACKFLF